MDSRKKDTIYSFMHGYKWTDDMRKKEEQVDPIVGKR